MAGVQVEIITPSELFYKSVTESLTCTTTDGEEGFLPKHAWCCKLLSEKGRVRVKTPEGTYKTASIKGGYVEIRDNFVVFTQEAEWIDK